MNLQVARCFCMAALLMLTQRSTLVIPVEKNHLLLISTQPSLSLRYPLALCLSQTGETQPRHLTRDRQIVRICLEVMERPRRLMGSR